MSSHTATASIEFEAAVSTIDASTLVRVPLETSRLLPSRGQVAVHGSINGHVVRTMLEPDGLRGHWIKVGEDLRRTAGIAAGDTVRVVLATTPEWPEPNVPDDLAAALADAPSEIRDVWDDITPMARWEWVRWVNATASPSTRLRRVDVTISKIEHGKRRPCCFDLSACTDPTVARNGKLRNAT